MDLKELSSTCGWLQRPLYPFWCPEAPTPSSPPHTQEWVAKARMPEENQCLSSFRLVEGSG